MTKSRIAILITLLWLAAGVARAQEPSPETRIKAAFLYKFCHYVEWPERAFAGPDSPIRIGVVGDAAIARELERVTAGRRVQQRPLQVRAFAPDGVPGDIHLLYVGRETPADRAALLSSLQGRPVLLVTESPEGLDSGGSINFTEEGDRVRFDVSLVDADARSLRIGSQLLSVARQVRRTGS